MPVAVVKPNIFITAFCIEWAWLTKDTKALIK